MIKTKPRMTSEVRPKLGAHVKTAGGLSNAIGNAVAIGAECIQIFGASPQQWRAALPSAEEAEKFKKLARENGIGPVFLHAAYLVNLASPDEANVKKSIASLAAHLRIAEMIGAEGLIFHLGSAKGGSREAAIKKTAEGMLAVLEQVPGKTRLVMENSAGGGDKLGAALTEIGAIFHAAESARVKVCIDTAHALESGAIEAYTPAAIKRFCDEFEKEIGLKNLAAMHINDSKTAALSHHDRHENLGEGFIGLSGFQNLAREKQLHHAAWILEVPGFEGDGPDKRNMDILKSCFLENT